MFYPVIEDVDTTLYEMLRYERRVYAVEMIQYHTKLDSRDWWVGKDLAPGGHALLEGIIAEFA
jgi:hypothetical protein